MPMLAVGSPEYDEVGLDALESLRTQRGLASMSDLVRLKAAWACRRRDRTI